ncbi:GNAT family N-acetyltransferase [bacterium]|nr:GNAT family N-acetyltransferase [bacterium]
MQAQRVALCRHTSDDLAYFLEWYADRELARLTRHDQTPLSRSQIVTYFQTIIMPSSARGHCFGIQATDSTPPRLIGTCSLTDLAHETGTLRILIGPHECWGKGYGTEAVRLLVAYGFEHLKLREIVLGVFDFNERAIRSYERVGFRHASTIRLNMPLGLPPAQEYLMTITPTSFQHPKNERSN